MVKLVFGKDSQLKFHSEAEYYEALGSFCNTKAFTISLEFNKRTGSYSDAYRIRTLSAACNLIPPIATAIRSNGRINCNEYISSLIENHNFVANGSAICGVFDNVINTVPTQYAGAFIKGYKECTDSTNQTKEIVFKTESIETKDVTLKEADIPRRQQHNLSHKKKLGKRDYVQATIRNIEIGEAGEKLVYENELKLLHQALKDKKIDSLKDKIEWVARDDDGAGYDIKSYDVETNRIKFIEVKSTTGDKSTSFYMSENEVDFSKSHTEDYYLYRLYGLTKSQIIYYYVIKGDILQNAKLEVTNNGYEINIKSP